MECAHGQQKTGRTGGLVFAPIHTAAPVYSHTARRGQWGAVGGPGLALGVAVARHVLVGVRLCPSNGCARENRVDVEVATAGQTGASQGGTRVSSGQINATHSTRHARTVARYRVDVL